MTTKSPKYDDRIKERLEMIKKLRKEKEKLRVLLGETEVTFDRLKELDKIKKINASVIMRDIGVNIKMFKIGKHRSIVAFVPWRQDLNADLNYFKDKSSGYWVWKDMSTDDTGTNIDFIMRAMGYGYVEAVKYLRERYIYKTITGNR
ncbi:MAG: hypothetical protein QW726_05995 [Fervidicoccaceae archaeon]